MCVCTLLTTITRCTVPRRPVSLSRNPSMSRGNVFLGASNKKAKVIVLQIKDLDSHVSLRTAERCCTVTQVYPGHVMHSIWPGLTWFNNPM